MSKEIHWLLHSLNEHLHYLDKADEAYPHIQELNDEVMMWRKKYAEDQLYTEKEKTILCSLPTSYFKNRTPLQVKKDFINEQK